MWDLATQQFNYSTIKSSKTAYKGYIPILVSPSIKQTSIELRRKTKKQLAKGRAVQTTIH